MARIDKIKEEIGWLKVIFGILIATDISLIAWLVENFGICPFYSWLNRCFLVTFTIVWIDNTVHRKIDELEEL